jgi:hypothetical protein
MVHLASAIHRIFPGRPIPKNWRLTKAARMKYRFELKQKNQSIRK